MRLIQGRSWMFDNSPPEKMQYSNYDNPRPLWSVSIFAKTQRVRPCMLRSSFHAGEPLQNRSRHVACSMAVPTILDSYSWINSTCLSLREFCSNMIAGRDRNVLSNTLAGRDASEQRTWKYLQRVCVTYTDSSGLEFVSYCLLKQVPQLYWLKVIRCLK